MSGVILKETVVDSSASKLTDPGNVKDQASVPVDVCEKVIVSSVLPLSFVIVIENVAALLGSTLISEVPVESEVPYIFFTLALPAVVSLLLDSPTD